MKIKIRWPNQYYYMIISDDIAIAGCMFDDRRGVVEMSENNPDRPLARRMARWFDCNETRHITQFER